MSSAHGGTGCDVACVQPHVERAPGSMGAEVVPLQKHKLQVSSKLGRGSFGVVYKGVCRPCAHGQHMGPTAAALQLAGYTYPDNHTQIVMIERHDAVLSQAPTMASAWPSRPSRRTQTMQWQPRPTRCSAVKLPYCRTAKASAFLPVQRNACICASKTNLVHCARAPC